MYRTSMRTETRSRARQDVKSVHKSTHKVRKWKKIWVAVKDTSMLVYRWVPTIQDTPRKAVFGRTSAQPIHSSAGSIFPTLSSPEKRMNLEISPNKNQNNAFENNGNGSLKMDTNDKADEVRGPQISL